MDHYPLQRQADGAPERHEGDPELRTLRAPGPWPGLCPGSERGGLRLAVNLEAAASLEGPSPYYAMANAILSDPDIAIYGSPQVESYRSIRSIISEGLADVTSNGRDVMEVAQEMTERANEMHADLQ